MASVILDVKATDFGHRWLAVNIRKDVCMQLKSQRALAFLIFDSRMFAERVFCYFTGKRESTQPNKKPAQEAFSFVASILQGIEKEERLKNKIFQSRDLCLRALDTNSTCAKSVRRNERKTC